ncbi:arylacetamide deacetylase-like 4 [Perognathus longimembris pacificus]|uniref:arylacetamide deacetylase-like 4 n=1 Tax=Perognathus longimembris pacificus TaxID=214514 RepID=UPI00201905F3|nr:arylacetamide deacetylase-like 4 [Perognathus longimembris pacificus]
MVLLLLVLLGVLAALSLGVFVWVVAQHFLKTKIPLGLQHPIKFRFLHVFSLYVLTWGNILEKLSICSQFHFIQFVESLVLVKKDPKMVVTNLQFGTIPARLFQPKTSSPSLRRGIIFFHGGGLMMGSLDSYHSLCNFLARETDSVLISVGYRKCPDYHYPITFDDCLIASIHILKAPEIYGVDPSRIVLCGESVGASLVAGLTQALLGRSDLPQIRAQVLMYPCVQTVNLQLPSFQQNKNIPFLTQDLLLKLLCKYLAIDQSWEDAIVKGACVPVEVWGKYRKWLSPENLPERFRQKDSQQHDFPAPFNEAAYLETKQLFETEHVPLLADDNIIAQLPEAFLVTCEWDILRDDGLLYKKRLEDQGVPVTWYHAEDGFHGCILFFDWKLLSFSCALKIINAAISYIKEI